MATCRWLTAPSAMNCMKLNGTPMPGTTVVAVEDFGMRIALRHRLLPVETWNASGGRSRDRNREKSVVRLATLMPPGLLLIGSGQGRAAASLADSMDLPTLMVRAVGHISRRRYAA